MKENKGVFPKNSIQYRTQYSVGQKLEPGPLVPESSALIKPLCLTSCSSTDKFGILVVFLDNS